MKISIIAAAGKNRVIGANGKIPWHIPEDLKHFKELTMGHPIVMGRKTFESIGKPLPGRINIVVTNDKNYKAEGILVANSLDAAFEFAKKSLANASGEVFVIGGEQMYKLALPKAQAIYLTKVHSAFEGDAYFPEFNKEEWILVSSEDHEKDEKNPQSYSFTVYGRK